MIYIVATPIGNLRDISLRALDALKASDIVCCEDTRNTSLLLSHYDLRKRLVSFHEHNELKRSYEIVEWARQGKEIAIVSDAGMPGISDPGSRLIPILIEEDIAYTVIPGPSAFTTALVFSGLNSDTFKFMGFLSTKNKERRAQLDKIKAEKDTIILYEAPHRLDKTMEDLMEVIPHRRISIVRELTKVFEEHIDFIIADYKDQDFVKKGEMVLVIDQDTSEDEVDEKDVEDMLKSLVAKGYKKSQAAALVAKDYGLKKNWVYDISKRI
ncbi:MAG: 16S rRNA (cytidine(1402)-2'-O)-methyltransferase [Tissierellia bacterium]|nr:16S rRNA (cytidine(1402)-2'-O)-methyltransferase [Tissierellia bacterium]